MTAFKTMIKEIFHYMFYHHFFFRSDDYTFIRHATQGQTMLNNFKFSLTFSPHKSFLAGILLLYITKEMLWCWVVTIKLKGTIYTMYIPVPEDWY